MSAVHKYIHTLIFIMIFFFSIKKIKFKFRSQNAPVLSLFSAFGINIVFYAKKRTIIMKMRVCMMCICVCSAVHRDMCVCKCICMNVMKAGYCKLRYFFVTCLHVYVYV